MASKDSHDDVYQAAWKESVLNDKPIDWEFWGHKMPTLSVLQAAALMHGLDPSIYGDFRKLKLGSDAEEKAVAGAEKLCALAEAHDIEKQSLTEWDEWAEDVGYVVHSQFKKEAATLRQKLSTNNSHESKCTGPQPLTTSEIAECFSGWNWGSPEAARKALGKKPTWLRDCITSPGIQGQLEIRWHPVQVGAQLITKGFARANQVRARFSTKPYLKEWLEAWKDYEAEYLSTE